MKALRTIGLARAVRFFLGQGARVLLALAVVPQMRVLLLRIFGAKIGRNCIVHSSRFFNFYRGSFRNVTMGDDCFVGDDCLLDLAAPITLASQVTLAERVNIITHLNVGYLDHPLHPSFPAKTEGVRIDRGVFAGVGTTILCGVTIGEGSFIAAGAVVTKSLPSHVLAGGLPARIIRQLPETIGADAAPVLAQKRSDV